MSPRGRGVRVHGEVEGDATGAFRAVWECVRRVPRGRVVTYGQIATAIGGRLSPRAVGWAMHGSPRGVPWHRVVNASGACSTDRLPGMPPGLQRAMLEREGVVFRPSGTIPLERYRFELRPAAKGGRRRPT